MEEQSQEQLLFSSNQKGNEALLYRYNLVVKNKSGTTMWKCINRLFCSASMTVDITKTNILRRAEHTCNPPSSKNKTHGATQLCKRKVCENYQAVQEIFEECFVPQNEESDSDSITIPIFESNKRTLNHARNIFFGSSANVIYLIRRSEITESFKG